MVVIGNTQEVDFQVWGNEFDDVIIISVWDNAHQLLDPKNVSLQTYRLTFLPVFVDKEEIIRYAASSVYINVTLSQHLDMTFGLPWSTKCSLTYQNDHIYPWTNRLLKMI